MRVLENNEPAMVWYFFEEIAKIPHGSGNTQAISNYLVQFAEERNLFYRQDDWNNVIIIKEASAGYESVPPVIIQGHMDMVCEKEGDTEIDFTREGLSLYTDGDFVKARGTTLGGDDGIAVAFALAILDSGDIPHPRLEIVITVDEEIGMLGASSIDLSVLKGTTMLNIDSDEEGIFLTSCAGGMAVHCDLPVHRRTQGGSLMKVTLGGLAGGHSGSEIDKEHGNADILMGRVLWTLCGTTPLGLRSLKGGLKDNAIPREAVCEILLPEETTTQVLSELEKLDRVFKDEFSTSDAGVFIKAEQMGTGSGEVLDEASLQRLLFFLRTVPNGVIHCTQGSPKAVETSLNLGIMELTEESFCTVTSIRSSVASRKSDLCDRYIHIVEMMGGEAVVEGDYPAWEYKKQSPLRNLVSNVYRDLFGEDPRFQSIHAGLECGLFSQKIEGLDCVSFGPMNLDIHTPRERLSISSTQRVYQFLLELLKRMKP